MSQQGAERRGARRIDAQVQVEYATAEDFLVDYSANLSIGGIFIRTDRPLAEGTRLRLRFRLPGRDEPLETTGVVRWSVGPGRDGPIPPGMGIRFERLSEEGERLVADLMARWEADNL